MTSLQLEAAELRKAISKLEKERDRQLGEAQATTEKLVQAVQATKLAETQLMDSKRRIAEAESKLQQQQVTTKRKK